MALLQNLSDDALGIILDSCSETCTAFLLWLCGFKDLQTKLERCCPSFNTPAVSARRRLPAWPSLLSRFTSLRSVTFKALEVEESLVYITQKIQKLPPTLTRLEICFLNAPRLLFSDAKIYQEATGSGFTEELTAEIWDVGARFPLLRELILDDPSGRFSLVPIASHSLTMFPPCLETLVWSIASIRLNAVSKLPRGLKTLDVRNFTSSGTDEVFEHLPNLPPTLEYLTGYSIPDIAYIERLPKTLKNGDWLPTISYTLSLAVLLPPKIESFPPKILVNSFDFDLSGIRWAKTLPSSLTELSVSVQLSVEDLSCLPRTITQLSGLNPRQPQLLQYWLEKPDEYQALWPPRLSSLTLSRGAWETPFDAEALPRTLTELQKWSPLRIGSQLPLLPPNLKTLDIYAPGRLMSFKAKEGSLVHLTTLKFDSSTVKIAGMSKLFPSLTKLQIAERHLHTSEERDVVAHFPPNLVELHIASLHSCSFRKLPRGLRFLSIRDSFHGVITDEVQFLPRSLTELQLRRQISTHPFQSSCLLKLPPKLAALNLGSAPCDSAILYSIPPSVRYLNLELDPTTIQNIDVERLSYHCKRWFNRMHPAE